MYVSPAAAQQAAAGVRRRSRGPPPAARSSRQRGKDRWWTTGCGEAGRRDEHLGIDGLLIRALVADRERPHSCRQPRHRVVPAPHDARASPSLSSSSVRLLHHAPASSGWAAGARRRSGRERTHAGGYYYSAGGAGGSASKPARRVNQRAAGAARSVVAKAAPRTGRKRALENELSVGRRLCAPLEQHGVVLRRRDASAQQAQASQTASQEACSLLLPKIHRHPAGRGGGWHEGSSVKRLGRSTTSCSGRRRAFWLQVAFASNMPRSSRSIFFRSVTLAS